MDLQLAGGGRRGLVQRGCVLCLRWGAACRVFVFPSIGPTDQPSTKPSIEPTKSPSAAPISSPATGEPTISSKPTGTAHPTAAPHQHTPPPIHSHCTATAMKKRKATPPPPPIDCEGAAAAAVREEESAAAHQSKSSSSSSSIGGCIESPVQHQMGPTNGHRYLKPSLTNYKNEEEVRGHCTAHTIVMQSAVR